MSTLVALFEDTKEAPTGREWSTEIGQGSCVDRYLRGGVRSLDLKMLHRYKSRSLG